MLETFENPKIIQNPMVQSRKFEHIVMVTSFSAKIMSKSTNQSWFFFHIYPIPLFLAELAPHVSVSIPTGMTSTIALVLNFNMKNLN